MAIRFSCPCGKSFSLDDNLAGKRAKCPKCAAPLTVPRPDEPELVEDFDYVVDEEEEKPAKPKKAEKNPFDFDKSRKKKNKKRSEDEEEGGLAAMYMSEALKKAEREEKLVQGNDGGGWTILGITVTAGVLGGLGSILLALVGGAVALFVPEARTPRVMIGAGVLFVLGGVAIINALFGGGED